VIQEEHAVVTRGAPEIRLVPSASALARFACDGTTVPSLVVIIITVGELIPGNSGIPAQKQAQFRRHVVSDLARSAEKGR
jgi:hypothetical protein